MSLDISDTLAPKSDQLDAVDLIGNPRTFTVAGVSRGNAEQPVQIKLEEFPRVWRPGVSMRRVLAFCWGTDASSWVGRRVRLYCDERVMFGNDVVGGTRISHLSHIDKPRSVPLLVKRGKSATFKVEPLPDETPADRVSALRAEWKSADPDRRKVIEAEVAALSQPPVSGAEDAPDVAASVSEQLSTSAPESPTDPDADYLAAVHAQDEEQGA
jgi:hypothetical protein